MTNDEGMLDVVEEEVLYFLEVELEDSTFDGCERFLDSSIDGEDCEEVGEVPFCFVGGGDKGDREGDEETEGEVEDEAVEVDEEG